MTLWEFPSCLLATKPHDLAAMPLRFWQDHYPYGVFVEEWWGSGEGGTLKALQLSQNTPSLPHHSPTASM